MKYHFEHVDLTMSGDFQFIVVIRINYAQINPIFGQGSL